MPVPTIKGTDFLQSDTGTVLTVNPGNAVANDIVLYVSYVPSTWTGPTTEKGTWTTVNTFTDRDGFRLEALISKVTDVGPYNFIYSGANATAWAYAVAMTTVDDETISVGASQETQRGPAIAPSVNASALSGRLFYIAPLFKGIPHGGPPTNAGGTTLAKVIPADSNEWIQFYSGEQIASGASGTSENSASGGGGDRLPAMHVWVPPSPSIESITPAGSTTPATTFQVTEVTQDLVGAIGSAGELTVTPSIVLDGAISPTATLDSVQLDEQIVEGAITPIGSLALMPILALGGAIGPTGAREPDTVGSPYEGAVTPFATLQFTVLQTLDRAASISPVGELELLVMLDLEGSISPDSVIVYATQLSFDGSISPTSEREYLPQQHYDGSITPIGEGAAQSLQLLLVEGSIAPSGTLRRDPLTSYAGAILPFGQIDQNVGVFLSGSISPIAETTVIEPTKVEEEGSISPTGELTLLVEADKDETFGRITPNATLVMEAQVAFAGSIAPTGARTFNASTEPSGSITPVGDVTGIISQALSVEGSIGPTGTLRNDAVLELQGSMSPIGDFVVTIPLTFEGQVTPVGALATSISRVLRLHATLNVNGDLALDPTVLLDGSIGPAGELLQEAGVNLEGSISPTGVMTVGDLESLKWRRPKFKDFDKAREKRMQP